MQEIILSTKNAVVDVHRAEVTIDSDMFLVDFSWKGSRSWGTDDFRLAWAGKRRWALWQWATAAFVGEEYVPAPFWADSKKGWYARGRLWSGRYGYIPELRAWGKRAGSGSACNSSFDATGRKATSGLKTKCCKAQDGGAYIDCNAESRSVEDGDRESSGIGEPGRMSWGREMDLAADGLGNVAKIMSDEGSSELRGSDVEKKFVQQVHWHCCESGRCDSLVVQ